MKLKLHPVYCTYNMRYTCKQWTFNTICLHPHVGQLAAFFAVMEQPHARKQWPFRWSHLFLHTMGMSIYTTCRRFGVLKTIICILFLFLECDTVVRQKERPLSYLLDTLNLLFIDKDGLCLIELNVSDSPSKHKSVLPLLSAVFKQCK